ncbi:MAG: DUF3142 domain-containing protein [Victivallales bacterium]|jgi:hypothetical protein
MIKIRIFLISAGFLSLLQFGCGKKNEQENHWRPPDKPAFYVWQRKWDNSLVKAVKERNRKTYLLAAEFSLKGKLIRCARTAIPEQIKKQDTHCWVFRINNGLLNKLEVDVIVKEFRRLGGNELQLDLDCPESKMLDYARYISKLREKIPDAELSITVLPVHLTHREFGRMVSKLDYYVLQVHGLKIPENINDDMSIVKRSTAIPAVKHAEKLGFPYLIALPAYAYQLYFDKRNGNFKLLSAGYFPRKNKNLISQLTTLDMVLLRDIIKMKRNGGIVWFHFPAAGDRLSLDISALDMLERGFIPAPSVRILCERNQDGFIELYVLTQNIIILGRFEIKIEWPMRMGEFDLFNGARNMSGDSSFMALPDTLSVPYSACGKKLKIGTFYVNTKPENIKVTLK